MAEENPKRPIDTTEYKTGRVSVPNIGTDFSKPAAEIAEVLLRQYFSQSRADVCH